MTNGGWKTVVSLVEKQKMKNIVPDNGNLIALEMTMKQYKAISVINGDVNMHDKIFDSVVKL